jgi:hypothetical protein
VTARTLVIGAASPLGVVISRALLPLPELAMPGAMRVRWVVEALLWSTSGTGLATLASHVIYGLHEHALEARRLGQYELEEKIGTGWRGRLPSSHGHAAVRR